MPLAPGDRLGPYEVLAPLGAGGMGEVFRARDTRLGRDVAIKVLPDHLAGDHKALARFESEAKAVARLSHPNILAIHDFGRISGVTFVVTELLEGESLRSALAPGPLPLKRALDVATRVAEGLAAAHEKGIVHRDVKPENVFLTRDGHAKLLDFGLARHEPALRSADETHSPTLTAHTEPGAVVGTVAYMSPEQSRGLPVDHRSDQFSLGVVLYEMLAGRRPFARETAAEALAALIRDEPEPLATLAPAVPPPVRWIVERCLSKEASGRYASTSDLARDLADCRQHLSDLVPPSATTSIDAEAPRRARWPPGLRAAFAALSALAFLGAGVVLDRLLQRRAEPARHPKLVRLTWEPGRKPYPSLAPDGESFAYACGPLGKSDVFLRRIGSENPLNLTKDCPEEDTMPAFSPDGQTIAFRSGRDGGGIFLMGATGESVRRLTDFGFEPAWSPDGRSVAVATDRSDGVVSARNGEIWIVDVASGTKRMLVGGDAIHPSWSPGGSRIAFHRRGLGRGGTALSTIPVNGGTPSDVVQLTRSLPTVPDWTPDGIWFASGDDGVPNIWFVRVDEKTGARLGAPEPVTTSTLVSWFHSATRDGRRLLFTSWDFRMTLVLHGFDPVRGRVLPGERVVLSSPRDIRSPRPSPDGVWLATVHFDESLQDLVLVRSATGETRRLTHDALREEYLAWAPDGGRIFFGVAPEGKWEVWSLRPDGSGRERVVAVTGKDVTSPLPSPDGRSLYVELPFADLNARTSALVDLAAPPDRRQAAPLPPMGDGRSFSASGWSPDGRFLLGRPVTATGTIEPEMTLLDVERRSYRTLARLDALDGCAFLPDSRQILLWSKGMLRLLHLETGALTPAGSVADDFRRLWLSLDGRTLAGDKATTEGDIWMLDYGRPAK